MPTTREVLETTIALEKESMALYARFAQIFSSDPILHEFWFSMARDEARHVGALYLVSTVLELQDAIDKVSPITFDASSFQLLRGSLERCRKQADSAFDIQHALGVAVEVEETELEDLVADLLKGLQERDEYERCLRLLVHDLGELSYMIEQYCQDSALLQRCDELVNHHAETLRTTAR
ncbi:MAG: ferritin family protein [Candidatus Binataceae bacterium]